MSRFHAASTGTVLKELSAKPPTDGNRIPINFSWEIIGVKGYIDLDTSVISITVSAFGVNLGTFTGDLKNGIKIDINVGLASGYLKSHIEGSTLYLDVDINVIFGPHYDQDHIKVFSWQMTMPLLFWNKIESNGMCAKSVDPC
ncbi:uncharacterized protein N7483_002275 [Penicillium malachiteum]|uniref:uncharacterized protein n=1 Tax=Penicillium malachiteum TaxID=1324776 RepID=UPI00254786FD|nr:uncharacterized protein N7483_002275 [Penicillium malachiteum]KAJ5737150.1 hypothetical protein N7483_002275 [Penicillium malachiteum]